MDVQENHTTNDDDKKDLQRIREQRRAYEAEVTAERARVKFDGEAIRFAGALRIVPALGFKQLRELQPKIQQMQKMDVGIVMSEEALDVFIDIVHAALSRNYPNMSKAEVEDGLDLGSVHDILPLVLRRSGFTRKELSPGEAMTPSPSP